MFDEFYTNDHRWISEGTRPSPSSALTLPRVKGRPRKEKSTTQWSICVPGPLPHPCPPSPDCKQPRWEPCLTHFVSGTWCVKSAHLNISWINENFEGSSAGGCGRAGVRAQLTHPLTQCAVKNTHQIDPNAKQIRGNTKGGGRGT